ncbi:glycosyltransferase family 59 protein [Jackrogersella minutella]|nr:glycosyltransferase family 59 protein [Jackrogersella minutella]
MAPWLGLDPSFAVQLMRYALISTVFHIYAIRKIGPLHTGAVVFLSLATLTLLGRQWLSLVTEYTPEPYLDEVFHIPQAQVYCDGKYSVWDDKITTPPGLYALTILANRLTGFPCSVYYLRLFNVEAISYLALAATVSRIRLEKGRTGKDLRIPHPYSTYGLWTGINVALFPVLFFFSGLYYTDVISTFVVLLSYTNHLGRVSQERTSLMNDIYTLFLGLLSLSMRQTNIFWVVVYMGGLEVVCGIKTLRPEPVATPSFTTLSQQISFYAWRYSLGEIHDPPSGLTSPIDLVLCALSIGIAALVNLVTIIRQRIWPHLAILGAFVGFVAWNGGVVLGDKSNHVATLHLAQMLYIWPLFAFFSVPLFIPQLLDVAILGWKRLAGSNPAKAPLPRNKPKGTNEPNKSAALKIFNQVGSSHMTHCIVVLTGALAAATLIVRYNTIIHPFTLADNRHYMFYVFRYTILKAWWIRYALVPVYIACGWLCWTTLRGSHSSAALRDRQWIRTPFSSVSNSEASQAPQASRPPQVDRKQAASNPSQPSQPSQPHQAQQTPDASTTSPPTSSVLILLLAATLSLITAPLVEPRYFILPWVFWRLLVPARVAVPRSIPTSDSPVSRYLVLVLETAWFLLVSAGTMYVFITRPFYWRAPDGELLDGGRVQRFMW